MTRLSYVRLLGRLYVYDNFDQTKTKFPVGMIEVAYGKRNGKTTYVLRMEGKLHSKHVDLEHAKEMVERLYPSNEIAWLRR